MESIQTIPAKKEKAKPVVRLTVRHAGSKAFLIFIALLAIYWIYRLPGEIDFRNFLLSHKEFVDSKYGPNARLIGMGIFFFFLLLSGLIELLRRVFHFDAYPEKIVLKHSIITPWNWVTINSEEIVAIRALLHPISTYAEGWLPIIRWNPKPPKEWTIFGYSNEVPTLAIQTRDKKYLVSIPDTFNTAITLRELYHLPDILIEPPPEKSQ